MARHTIRGRVSLTMALDTPSHLQRGDLTNSFHRFHRTVTSLTRDFSRDVPLVVKSSEIREPVNSNPLDGLLGLPIRVELLNLGTVGWDDAMTADAPLNRRHTCHRRTPGAIVAKETVDLVVSSMNPVVESDRLFRSVFPPPTPKKEQASNDSEDRGDDDAKSKVPAIIPHLSLSHVESRVPSRKEGNRTPPRQSELMMRYRSSGAGDRSGASVSFWGWSTFHRAIVPSFILVFRTRRVTHRPAGLMIGAVWGTKYSAVSDL